METATIFIVGHHNEIARGALLLVSDTPFTPEGIKTQGIGPGGYGKLVGRAFGPRY